MKTVLILRHAKSSWDDPQMSDHDRPLNERGNAAAPKIGSLLKEKKLYPDIIIASTARRAQETAKLVLQELDRKTDIKSSRDIYQTGLSAYFAAAQKLPDNISTVLFVGHNPDIEAFIERTTGQYERMPTAGLAQITFKIDSWKSLNEETPGQLINLWRPKEID